MKREYSRRCVAGLAAIRGLTPMKDLLQEVDTASLLSDDNDLCAGSDHITSVFDAGDGGLLRDQCRHYYGGITINAVFPPDGRVGGASSLSGCPSGRVPRDQGGLRDWSRSLSLSPAEYIGPNDQAVVSCGMNCSMRLPW